MSKEQIERYAFKSPLLFEGDRGSGKTYDIREFARVKKIPYLEIAGNESMESFDFLGHVMQSEKGLVWKDGKLSQAFRMAKDGKKVALLIDEMLRIPQRHLSVLLSALSADSEGNYRLQTGRMTDVSNGIGVEEEIVVPMESIAVFATTNVGPEFAIDDLDPAVAERFIILRKDTQISQLTKILEKKVALRSFNKLVALKLAEFYNKTTRMVKSGTLNRHATTRTLSRAVDIADDEQDVAQVLKDQILLWADRDSAGYPVTSQVDMLEKTIKELFASIPKSKTVAKAAPIKDSATKTPPKLTAKAPSKTILAKPAAKPKAKATPKPTAKAMPRAASKTTPTAKPKTAPKATATITVKAARASALPTKALPKAKPAVIAKKSSSAASKALAALYARAKPAAAKSTKSAAKTVKPTVKAKAATSSTTKPVKATKKAAPTLRKIKV